MTAAPGRLLVVAGHDPTGGAGVDADAAAARRFGVEAVCVVTAHTQQDGRRVTALGARAPEAWLDEARAAVAAATPAALKVGLLPGAEHVAALATLLDELAADGWSGAAVVDPVLAASGGEVFLDAAGRRALRALLLPRGVLLTPNVPEAALLADLPPELLRDRPRERLEAARRLLARGARAVVVKGGHGAEDPVRDLVLEGGAALPIWCERRRLPGAGIHGSGCRFASALAAGLVCGRPLSRAAAEAGAWLAACLAGAG